MKRFKDLLKNKFVWGEKDLEHDKKKPIDKALQKSMKFIWGPNDVEHHGKDVKEETLDEKFMPVPKEAKGNYENPHQIHHTSTNYQHNFSDNNGYRPPQHGTPEFEHYSEHHNSLDWHHHESGQHYKRTGYSEINGYLRNMPKQYKDAKEKYLKHHAGGKQKFVKDPHDDHTLNAIYSHKLKHNGPDHPDRLFSAHIDQHVDNLDHITSNRTPAHHTVFRGGIPGDKDRFPIGHEFTDHGYASTSFHHATAKYFAERNDTYTKSKRGNPSKPIVHVIHVPKGSRAHYFDIGSDRHSDDDERNWGNGGEGELVLHRGTRFKVTHHSEGPDVHYIHSRVIKQGIRPKYSMEKKQAGPPVHGKQASFPFVKTK